jgi:hypothetical protein
MRRSQRSFILTAGLFLVVIVLGGMVAVVMIRDEDRTPSDSGDRPEVTASGEDETASSKDDSSIPFPIVLAAFIVIGLAAVILSVRLNYPGILSSPGTVGGKRKRRRPPDVHARALKIEQAARKRATHFPASNGPRPVIHQVSTYVYGDRHYDESFGIELADNTYLGECGMSIATPVNRYDRDKVAAFEVWLFDKQDIHTQAAVLASRHAHGDPAERAKLARKGEVLPAEVDAVVVLETKTLRLRARVLAGGYGFADTLPSDSFFDHLVVEIAVWQGWLPHGTDELPPERQQTGQGRTLPGNGPQPVEASRTHGRN